MVITRLPQGQDVFELDLTQSFLMTSIGPRFVAGVLKGNCNAQATAAASQVSAGVAIDFQVLTPALVGNCAPLGQFANSNFTRIQVDPLMDVNAALFFSFGQGVAGQAISLPLEIRLVPEPGTLIVFASGLLMVVAFMRRSDGPRGHTGCRAGWPRRLERLATWVLGWSQGRRMVRVRIGDVIPNEGPQETVAGQRRRFANVLHDRLKAIGWVRADTEGKAPHTFRPKA